MHKLYDARETYIDHALDLSDAEQALITDFASWLPAEVIDGHAHSNRPEDVDDIADSAYHHMFSTFPSYTIDESKAIQATLHPGITMRTLRFAHAFRGINHRAANDYLLAKTPPEDRVALYGLPDDEAYTVEMLAHPGVSALKMYYAYLEPPATKIYEVFTPRILEAAEENQVPIVLHTPRMIVESVIDVVRVTRDFPHLGIAIAHLGSSKFDVPGLQAAYDVLADTDIYLDTALNPSAEVCLRALRTFGPERIIYGSDEPLHLIRSVPFVHPTKGQRLATQFPYHWQDPADHAEYKHLADGAVHSHWLALSALRQAIETLPAGQQASAKARIFHDNASRLYGF